MQYKRLVLCLCLFCLFFSPGAFAQDSFLEDIPPSIKYLKQLELKKPPELQPENLTPLIRFALDTQKQESALPDLDGMSGAFHKFRVPAGIGDIIRYGYNPRMPAYIFRPACVRTTEWKNIYSNQGNASLPSLGDKLGRVSADPMIIQGKEYEEITPDRNSGAYYGYEQKRTLALFKAQNSTVFISVCLQDEDSSVARKGAILGPDTDWNYFYSGEKGINKAGLGWVDSYIYSAFTVTMYVQKPGEKESTGLCFNWLRAGWMGMNFVKSKHVLAGLKRFTRDVETVFSSPNLPRPQEIIAFKKRLENCPKEELAELHQKLFTRACADSENDLVQEHCPEIDQGTFSENIERKYLEARLGLYKFKKWLNKDTLKKDLFEKTALEQPQN